MSRLLRRLRIRDIIIDATADSRAPFTFYSCASIAMSYTRLLIHIVFGTKERRPHFNADLRPRLHGYLRDVVTDRRCRPVAVGGWVDHVHVMVDLNPTVAVADLVRDLKANSSRWCKTTGGVAAFEWQPCTPRSRSASRCAKP